MDTGRYQSVAPGDHITSQCIRLMTTPALSVSLNMRSREEGSGRLAFSFFFFAGSGIKNVGINNYYVCGRKES